MARTAGASDEVIAKIKAEAPEKKSAFASAADQGLQQANDNVISGANFLLSPYIDLFTGKENNPLRKAREISQKEQEKRILKTEEAVKETGNNEAARVMAKFVTTTVSTLPDTIMALMSGGGSAVINPAASKGLNSVVAALDRTTGLASTIKKAVIKEANNPMFWGSFAKTIDGEYRDAKNQGATETQAMTAAIISSLVNAGIEVGGGIETLPQDIKGKTGAKAVLEWLKSAHSEGQEEVIQDIVSSTMQAALYDKTRKVISTDKGENALLNIPQLGEDYAYAAASAALLNAPTSIISSIQQAAIDKIKNADVTPEERNVIIREVLGRSITDTTPQQIKIDENLIRGIKQKSENISNDVIDNNGNVEYNENNKRGDNYGKTDEFRRVQEASRGLSDTDTKMFHTGERRLDEGLREQLSGIFKNEIRRSGDGVRNVNQPLVNPKTGNTINIVQNVDGNTFHDIFEVAQKYLRNGDAVDVHSTEDYKNTNNYLSDTGLSGFAVTESGDLVSVFSLGEQGFLRTVKDFVRESGAKTLDCFDSIRQPLGKIYQSTLGFQTAAVSTAYMDKNNNPAPLIKFTKAVDGTMYVVEAVPDSSYKKLWVTSAYIQKNDSSQALNAEALRRTPEAVLAAESFSTNSILPNSENSNTFENNSQNGASAFVAQDIERILSTNFSNERKAYILSELAQTTGLSETDIEALNRAQSTLNGAQTENNSFMILDSSQQNEIFTGFGITNPRDYIQTQKRVYETLQNEGFFTDENNSRRTDVNEESGMIVEVDRKGLNETFNDENYGKNSTNLKALKLASVKSIPEIIRTGKVIEDNAINIHRDNSSVKYAYIEKTVNINGKPVTVKLAIRKSPQKNKFWVHSIETDEKTTSKNIPAGISEDSKTGYLSSDVDNGMISQKDGAVNPKTHPNTVGAMESNPNGYYYATNKYGTIPHGENPARIVDVPAQMNDNTKVSKFVRTVMEAEVTPDSLIEHFETQVKGGTFSYEVATDKKAVETATNRIASAKDFNEAVNNWKSDSKVDKNHIVTGEMLYSMAAANGNIDLVDDISATLQLELTNAGQVEQAARLLKKMTSEGRLYYLQKAAKQIKTKNGTATIDADLAANFFARAGCARQVHNAARRVGRYQDLAGNLHALPAGKDERS